MLEVKFDGLDTPAQAWARALSSIALLSRQGGTTLAAMIDEQVALYAEQPALIEIGIEMTYRELASRKNRFTHWALANGLRPGDVVCVLMVNSADYVALWLGLTQIGIVAALVNASLAGDALLHVLKLCAAAHVIADEACAPALHGIQSALPGDVRWWRLGFAGSSDLWTALEISAMPDAVVGSSYTMGIGGSRTALLLFTSGTTGLPKAAKLSHKRMLEWCLWFAGLIGAGPRDRLFNCLPMYHATGGIVGCGAMLVSGGAVVIRRHFSASKFWSDVEAERCTIFLYIGELCRYLLQSVAVTRSAPRHHLRLCCGNGLQGDIWEQFQTHFAIPKVLEFYASTEGNVALYNCEGRPGSIGRLPPSLAFRSPVVLVACDLESGELLRGENGLCMPCPQGQSGEALGRISATEATRGFEGYTDHDATSRKVAHDVLAKGDAWFRTGDLMRKDADGFFYFVDRLGDTFRWKGENVATTQVAQTLLRCPGISGAVVYPVAVPGHDGRAGMAAITTEPGFDIKRFAKHVTSELINEAQPLFLRICASLPSTQTYKPVKSQLASEGFDIARTPMNVYLRDRLSGRYTLLDATHYAMILAAELRL